MSGNTERAFRVVCMDCPAVLQEGAPHAPISHGLCDECFKKQMAKLDDLKKELGGC